MKAKRRKPAAGAYKCPCTPAPTAGAPGFVWPIPMGAGTMRVSDILDILFFTLRQLGLFGLCFFYIRFILICAFSGWG